MSPTEDRSWHQNEEPGELELQRYAWRWDHVHSMQVIQHSGTADFAAKTPLRVPC